ncbi:hypothetical protein TNCV_4290291 [Trichonephila clavipes]|nr:hypothetical protein TNCV_4290291 [Trichonephila clavipes]
MKRSPKNSVKTSMLPRDICLAVTKRTLHYFQQGYEFYNDVYADGKPFNELLCKAVSTSATFVFTMDALLIVPCLQPILCHGTVAVNDLTLTHLVLFNLDISAEMLLLYGNEIF